MYNFCGDCGSKLNEKGLCPNCSKVKSDKKSPKGFFVVLLLIIIIAAITLLSVFVFDLPQMLKKDSKEDADKNSQALLVEGLEEYFELDTKVNEIESEYISPEGDIIEGDVEQIIDVVGQFAEEKYNADEIQDYEVTEGQSVWIKLNSGVEYIYLPEIEGCDSSGISTYQPCLDMYQLSTREYSSAALDESAVEITEKIDEYVFENDYDNEEISLDVLKEIGNDQFVIWHGHGGYNTSTHSILLTSVQLDEVVFMNDSGQYVSDLGYTEDFLAGNILCGSDGNVLVTHKFFEKHIDSVEDSIIYLGACSTGVDDVLANTFLSKGAKAVLVNTGVIHTYYNLDMIDSITDGLTEISLKDKKFATLEDALASAKADNEAFCCAEHSATEVKIYGDTKSRLTDKDVDITEIEEQFLENAEHDLEDKYGLSSQEEFISCLGTDIQQYPSGIDGVVSTLGIDLNNDDFKELITLRIGESGDSYGDVIIAEVYEYNDGEAVMSSSSDICSISYSCASDIYMFYSEVIDEYCIIVDSFSSGTYTGVNSGFADMYIVSTDSIEHYARWESVPMLDIEVDFTEEFTAVGAPYAKYCTELDNRDNNTYYQPLCEIEHEVYSASADGDLFFYENRNHKLKIKSTIE